MGKKQNKQTIKIAYNKYNTNIMKDKKWNREDWQGRSKNQVEGNYKAIDLMFKIIAGSFIVFAIWKILENTIK